jgi:hypothetical protein
MLHVHWRKGINISKNRSASTFGLLDPTAVRNVRYYFPGNTAFLPQDSYTFSSTVVRKTNLAMLNKTKQSKQNTGTVDKLGD